MYKLGHYIPINSPIHHLDPRVKILSVIVISILILRARPLFQTAVSAGLLLLVYASHLQTQRIIKSIRPMFFFILLIFLLHALLTEGSPLPLFPDWKITVTYQGLSQGILVAWRFLLLLCVASVLTMTTSPYELVMGLEHLLRPFKIIKVPSHDIAIMVSIALRFVPTILEEIEKIKMAQAARGALIDKGFRSRIKFIYFLFIPVILGSFRRADELALAMEGRGYRRGHRTYLKELNIEKVDYMAILVLLIFTGVYFLSN